MKTIGRYCLKIYFSGAKKSATQSQMKLELFMSVWDHGVLAPVLYVQYGPILMKGECLLPFGPESSDKQFATQKCKD